MKRLIILVFPMAAELLFYASAIPLQQNRYNGVVGRSIPSYPSAFDSALTQRSQSDTPNWMRTVLFRPDGITQSQNPPSTQPPAQGIVNPTHDANPPPISAIMNAHLPNQVIHPSVNLVNQPFQPTGHSAANVNLGPHHGSPTIPPSAHAAPLSGSIHVQLVDGGAPYGADMLDFHISQDWYILAAPELADKLRARETTSTSQEEQAIVNMRIMNVVFEKSLEQVKPASFKKVMQSWRREMQAFADEPGVSNSQLVHTWKIKLTIQMEAMTSLHQGKAIQNVWDAYWIDDRQSSTTRLKEKSNRKPPTDPRNVLYIMEKYASQTELTMLESANPCDELLRIANNNLQNQRSTSNGLFLLRKGIQMWMEKGMSREEFDEQEKELRKLALSKDPTNQIRAEMVLISLRRFMKDKKIKLIGQGPGV